MRISFICLRCGLFVVFVTCPKYPAAVGGVWRLLRLNRPNISGKVLVLLADGIYVWEWSTFALGNNSSIVEVFNRLSLDENGRMVVVVVIIIIIMFFFFVLLVSNKFYCPL